MNDWNNAEWMLVVEWAIAWISEWYLMKQRKKAAGTANEVN